MIKIILIIIIWLILGWVGIGGFILSNRKGLLPLNNADVAFFIFFSLTGPVAFIVGLVSVFVLMEPREKHNWKLTDWLNDKFKELNNDKK